MLENIKNDPALPVWWGKNQSGMQAREELDFSDKEKAIKLWLEARDQMVAKAEEMAALGVHKQIANRLTEPWMFITVLLTATEFEHWFSLRSHPDAQPEIKWVSDDMFGQYKNSIPWHLGAGDWHLPLINGEDIETAYNMCEQADHNAVDNLLRKVSTRTLC